jgi:hypothetical protein
MMPRFGSFCDYHGVLHPAHPYSDWRLTERWSRLRYGPGIHTGRHRVPYDERVARAEAFLARWWQQRKEL